MNSNELFKLAENYELMLNDNDKALIFYKEVLKLYPGSNEAEMAKNKINDLNSSSNNSHDCYQFNNTQFGGYPENNTKKANHKKNKININYKNRRKLGLPTALVLISIISICSFFTYIFYEDYKDYSREQQRQEERERQRAEAEAERERIEEKKEYHNENVHEYACQETAEWIVSKVYDGGKNVTIEINSYEYNPYNEEYKINVSLEWCGSFWGICEYAANGIIRVDEYGDNLKWESTYHNSSLRVFVRCKFFQRRNWCGYSTWSCIRCS